MEDMEVFSWKKSTRNWTCSIATFDFWRVPDGSSPMNSGAYPLQPATPAQQSCRHSGMARKKLWWRATFPGCQVDLLGPLATLL